MKLGVMIAAVAVLSLTAVTPLWAGPEFGAPEFPNYLSMPSAASCDWQYEAYFRACPTPTLPPKKAKAATETPAAAPPRRSLSISPNPSPRSSLCGGRG